MNKYELACQVAKEIGKPIAQVTPVVNALFDIMGRSILEGEKIGVTDLGTFRLRLRKQRRGYDMFRQRVIIIPEGMSLKFEISPSLLKKIKEKYDAHSPLKRF